MEWLRKKMATPMEARTTAIQPILSGLLVPCLAQRNLQP
jgi:hypothetical protein